VAFAQAPAAVALTVGSEHRYVLVNARAAALVGRDDLLGRAYAEAFPELAAQGFAALLDAVYASGVPHVAHDARVLVPRPAGSADPDEERYFDFVYQPLTGPDGRVTGVLQHAVEVTDRHRAEAAARGAAGRAQLLQALTAGFSAALTPEAVVAAAARARGAALDAVTGLVMLAPAAEPPAARTRPPGRWCSSRPARWGTRRAWSSRFSPA
jgi:hypothetical protein